jgi:hypothetical protein
VVLTTLPSDNVGGLENRLEVPDHLAGLVLDRRSCRDLVRFRIEGQLPGPIAWLPAAIACE